MAELLKGAVAGAVGGLVGTAFMKQQLKYGARLPEKFQGPAFTQDPAEFMAKQAEKLVGQVPAKARKPLVKGLHWAYGTAWPLAAGVALRKAAFESWGKALAAGAGLGAGVWAVGYLGWLPGAKLVDRVSHKKVTRQASALLGHIAYGIVSVAPLFLAARFWPRRRRFGFI
jgi:hypothetical protein